MNLNRAKQAKIFLEPIYDTTNEPASFVYPLRTHSASALRQSVCFGLLNQTKARGSEARSLPVTVSCGLRGVNLGSYREQQQTGQLWVARAYYCADSFARVSQFSKVFSYKANRV